MSEPPIVFGSLLNWNRPSMTIECVRALEKMDYPNLRLFIVDNGSKDGSADRFRTELPDVELIEVGENVGYAAGHKHVADRAVADGAELLWILNNDLFLEHDAISQLVDAYSRFGRGVYGSVPLDESPTDAGSAKVAFARKFLDYPYRERVFDLRRTIPYAALLGEEVHRVSAIPGSSMLIPTEIISNEGFFDTSFFLYSEEIDYCLRLEELGIPSYLVTAAKGFHRESSSSSYDTQLQNVMTYYRTRNQLLRIARHQGGCTYARASLKFLLMALWYLVNPWQSVGRCRSCLLGLWHSWRGRRGKTLSPEDVLSADG